jgi:2-iminobutanoate/2-iminopropanoate deaminase
MMKKQLFQTSKAPQPKGPYSQAVIYKDTLYISGQGPVEPSTGNIVRGTIEIETKATLNNLKTIIEDAGFDLKGVLKMTCYLSNMDDYESFNKVYGEYFTRQRPARTTIQAGRLPMDIKVEIDATVGRI